jgi:hypothetical protein
MEIVPEIDRLAQIFSNAIAPAFFLGSVAAFVSLMTGRLAAVNDRIRTTIASEVHEPGVAHSSTALDLLVRRARLLGDGIVLSLSSGICATLLLVILFTSQFFGFHRAYGAALLFIIATLLLGVALFRFAQEALHARRELLVQELRVNYSSFQPSSPGSKGSDNQIDV